MKEHTIQKIFQITEICSIRLNIFTFIYMHKISTPHTHANIISMTVLSLNYLYKISYISFPCFLRAWLRLLHGPLWAQTWWLRWLFFKYTCMCRWQNRNFVCTHSHPQPQTPWQEEILQLWSNKVQRVTEQWELQWHIGNTKITTSVTDTVMGVCTGLKFLWDLKGKITLEL